MKLGKFLTASLALGVIALMTPGLATAAIIGLEDFDGGAINLDGTTNVFDYDSGGGTGGDVFGRVSQYDGGSGTGGPFDTWDDSVTDTSGGGMFAGDARGVAGQNTSAFFSMVDSDGNIDGDGGSLNNAVWSFDISSATLITSIAIDLAAMGDWESASDDGFLIEARTDANAYQTIFQAIPNESIDPYEYRPMDSGTSFSENDPLELFIDGSAVTAGVLDKSVAATGAFDSYTSVGLAGASGSTLDIRVSWAGSPSGSEAIGIDNITINGELIPEPGTALLCLLAISLAGMVGLRSRWG